MITDMYYTSITPNLITDKQEIKLEALHHPFYQIVKEPRHLNRSFDKSSYVEFSTYHYILPNKKYDFFHTSNILHYVYKKLSMCICV